MIWAHISQAWLAAGQYFSKFVFATLASSAVLENLQKTLVVPASTEMEKTLMQMKSEIAGLNELPEKVRQRFNSCYNQANDAHCKLKIDTEAELKKGRKKCFKWAIATVIVMSLGLDSLLGPLAFLLLWPLYSIRSTIAKKINDTQNTINTAYEQYRADRQLVEDALAPYITQTDISLTRAKKQLDTTISLNN